MQAVTVQSLPSEVLENIFKLIEPSDLRSAVLVCQRWRDVGDTLKLWTWVHYRVDRRNFPNMPQVLDSRRLQNTKMVTVRSISEELIRALIRDTQIENVDLRNADSSLSTLDPKLLISLILKMNEVSFDISTLSDVQKSGIKGTLESVTYIEGTQVIKHCPGPYNQPGPLCLASLPFYRTLEIRRIEIGDKLESEGGSDVTPHDKKRRN